MKLWLIVLIVFVLAMVDEYVIQEPDGLSHQECVDIVGTDCY